MASIPEKFLPAKDSIEVVMFGFKVTALAQKHKADPPLEDQGWFKKLMNKADYLTALPLAIPAFDNIENCLNEIKDPVKVRLIGEYISQELDLPNDNLEARIKKVVLATSKYAADLQEAFA